MKRLLGPVTNTVAKRFGLSCAVVGAVVAIVITVSTEDPYRISRLAEQSLLEDRASELGLGTYQAEQQVRDACARKYANPDLAGQCYNAEMFGGFGEILARRRALIRAQYYGFGVLAMLATAAVTGIAAWALIALVVPICLNYWAWLRNG